MYLLDTNICIFLIKNKSEILKQKIFSCSKNEIFVSSVTVAEMEYGASKSQFREKNRNALLNFFCNFNNIIDFSTVDAENYGIIRAYLEEKGTPIGPYDLQLASQAVPRNLTLVTNNVKEFLRVPTLKVEDWTKE